MTKTTMTYALPPEPDGPVWDKDGNKWEYKRGFWEGPGIASWTVLLKVHGPLTNTEPEPAWPTAALLWWGGKVWERCGERGYKGVGAYWRKDHLSGPPSDIRAGARRFAREAVPAVVVPAAEWEAWKHATRDLDYTPDCELIDAVDSLAREVGE